MNKSEQEVVFLKGHIASTEAALHAEGETSRGAGRSVAVLRNEYNDLAAALAAAQAQLSHESTIAGSYADSSRAANMKLSHAEAELITERHNATSEVISLQQRCAVMGAEAAAAGAPPPFSAAAVLNCVGCAIRDKIRKDYEQSLHIVMMRHEEEMELLRSELAAQGPDDPRPPGAGTAAGVEENCEECSVLMA